MLGIVLIGEYEMLVYVMKDYGWLILWLSCYLMWLDGFLLFYGDFLGGEVIIYLLFIDDLIEFENVFESMLIMVWLVVNLVISVVGFLCVEIFDEVGCLFLGFIECDVDFLIGD